MAVKKCFICVVCQLYFEDHCGQKMLSLKLLSISVYNSASRKNALYNYNFENVRFVQNN